MFSSHPVYFITTNIIDRRNILACEEAADVLVAEWKAARRRHGWGIGRYVIMPDHVHFFCAEMLFGPRAAVAGGGDPGGLDKPASSRPATVKRLEDFMQAWKEWTSKGIARQLRLAPPIWQEEFFDHVLRSNESYAEKWSYVRDNPIRKQLVTKADEWPWQGFVDFDSPLQAS